MKNIYAILLASVFSILLVNIPEARAQRPDRSPVNYSGTLIDSMQNEPLPGGYVFLQHLRDTSIQLRTATDTKGRFSFKAIRPGGYLLTARFIGYEQYQARIFLRKNVTGSKIKLLPDAKEMEVVEIEGRATPVIQNGDTTEFNSQAFKTNPDANAEDLISKMPGIVVKDGQVQAQGETVQRVLVDGKPYFGDDPKAALKNIPSESIQKIQVYDQASNRSQATGFDDGEAVKTINIVTKPSMRRGDFGQFYAGYGEDNRYNVGGVINFFRGKRRFAVIGMSNNINQQNFSVDDLVGVTGGSGRRWGRGQRGRGGASPFDFLTQGQNGISTTHALGLNYSDEWGKKLEVSGSYFFNASQTDNTQSLNRETFLSSDSSQFYEETGTSELFNMNHRLRGRLKYQINKNNSLVWEPRISFQSADAREDLTGETFLLPRSILNETDNLSDNLQSGLNIQNELTFNHRFAKKGRSLTLSLENEVNTNLRDGELRSLNGFYSNDLLTRGDTLFQDLDYDNDERSIEAEIGYTEPLGKKLLLNTEYEFSYNRNDADQQVFDLNSGESNLLDTMLSNTFVSDYYRHTFGPSISFRGKGLSLSAGLDYRFAQLRNTQQFPTDSELSRDFHNLMPNLRIRYRISKEKNFLLSYRTRTSAPSVSQLQEVLDNSNPVQLSRGNPNLAQEFQHRLFTRFSSSDSDKGTSFFVFFFGSLTDNYIGNSTLIAASDTLINGEVLLNRGSQLLQTVNLDGYGQGRIYTNYAFPLGFMKSNMSLNSSVNYVRTPGLINLRENISNAYTLSQEVSLSSNISKKVDFSLSYEVSYNIVANSLQPELNQNYLLQNAGLKSYVEFPLGITLRNDLNFQQYDGLAEPGFDEPFILWNITLGKRLFKNERGELRITAFDVLNQNQSISRNVSDTFVEDARTQVLNRYLLVTFSYRLRKFEGAKNNTGGNGQPWRRR